MGNKRTKKSISLEGFVFLAIFLGIFGGMGMKNGRCQYAEHIDEHRLPAAS